MSDSEAHNLSCLDPLNTKEENGDHLIKEGDEGYARYLGEMKLCHPLRLNVLYPLSAAHMVLCY